jgi:ABC-2 type transport system permease protein
VNGTVVRLLRLVLRGWATHSRHLLSSGYFLMVSSIQPVVYATLAFFMFRAGGRPEPLMYAAIGAGMLSVWVMTLVGSGQGLTMLRAAGLLELMVCAPAPFAAVLAPITLATATVGLYSLVATLLWGWLLFGVPVHAEHPWLLLVAIPVTVFSLGMLGMVFASVFVRFRYANALTNLFTYPVWLLSGMLVPVDRLPEWTRPATWLLPPTWGVRAIRDSFLGGQPLPALGICLALGVAYLGLGLLTVGRFELLARHRASLALV